MTGQQATVVFIFALFLSGFFNTAVAQQRPISLNSFLTGSAEFNSRDVYVRQGRQFYSKLDLYFGKRDQYSDRALSLAEVKFAEMTRTAINQLMTRYDIVGKGRSLRGTGHIFGGVLVLQEP